MIILKYMALLTWLQEDKLYKMNMTKAEQKKLYNKLRLKRQVFSPLNQASILPKQLCLLLFLYLLNLSQVAIVEGSIAIDPSTIATCDRFNK